MQRFSDVFSLPRGCLSEAEPVPGRRLDATCSRPRRKLNVTAGAEAAVGLLRPVVDLDLAEPERHVLDRRAGCRRHPVARRRRRRPTACTSGTRWACSPALTPCSDDRLDVRPCGAGLEQQWRRLADRRDDVEVLERRLAGAGPATGHTHRRRRGRPTTTTAPRSRPGTCSTSTHRRCRRPRGTTDRARRPGYSACDAGGRRAPRRGRPARR